MAHGPMEDMEEAALSARLGRARGRPGAGEGSQRKADCVWQTTVHEQLQNL